MEKNIKDYRDKELKTFVFGNILFILLGTSLIDNIVEFLGVNSVWLAVGELFGSSVLCAFIYIFVFVFDSVIPGKIRAGN